MRKWKDTHKVSLTVVKTTEIQKTSVSPFSWVEQQPSFSAHTSFLSCFSHCLPLLAGMLTWN